MPGRKKFRNVVPICVLQKRCFRNGIPACSATEITLIIINHCRIPLLCWICNNNMHKLCLCLQQMRPARSVNLENTYVQNLDYIFSVFLKWTLGTKRTQTLELSGDCSFFWDQGSSVSIVSDWTTGRSMFDPQQRQEDFSSNLLCPDRLWGPPSLLSSGYRGSFPGGKGWPGRDADHSPPSSAEVVNE
jgi:hypothetical protein